MDFTGYRHNAATLPTTVMTASIDSKAPLPVQRVSSVAGQVRRSASRPHQPAMPRPGAATRRGMPALGTHTRSEVFDRSPHVGANPGQKGSRVRVHDAV